MLIAILLVLLVQFPLIAAGVLESGSIAEIDFGADSTIDRYYTTTNAFDRRGNRLLSVSELTGPQGEILGRSVTTYTNLGANQIQEVSSVHLDGLIIVDYTVTITTTLNDAGSPVSQIQENNFGSYTNWLISTWNYNYGQDEFIVETKGYRDTDPVAAYLSTTIYSVDSRRRPISFVEEEDVNEDGQVDVTDTGTYTYDKSGNLSQFTAHLWAGGTVPVIETVSYSYIHRGEITRNWPDGNSVSKLFLPGRQMWRDGLPY